MNHEYDIAVVQQWKNAQMVGSWAKFIFFKNYDAKFVQWRSQKIAGMLQIYI